MNQLHQDINRKANAQKLPTNFHLLLEELLCTRQFKIKFVLLSQYYKNMKRKRVGESFRLTKINLLGWQAASTTIFIHHLPSDKNNAIMIQLCKWYHFMTWLLSHHIVLVWDFYEERTPQTSDKLIQNWVIPAIPPQPRIYSPLPSEQWSHICTGLDHWFFWYPI